MSNERTVPRGIGKCLAEIQSTEADCLYSAYTYREGGSRSPSADLAKGFFKRDIGAQKLLSLFAGGIPLFIHDGGLLPQQIATLQKHFPNAALITMQQGTAVVESQFRTRGWSRALAYRQVNPSTIKLFDFFTMSRAETIISIDSDVLFFRAASELITKSP